MKASDFLCQFRRLNKVFRALCFATVLFVAVGDRQTARAQQPQEGHVGHFTKGPPTRVQVPLLSKPPEVKPGELDRMEKAIEQLHQTKGGTTPVGPNAKARQGPPTIPEVKPKDPGPPDTDLRGRRAAVSRALAQSSAGISWATGTDLSNGPARSPKNEPSADFNGAVGFVTYNKYTAMTLDWGTTWIYIDPTQIFPNSPQIGNFCCDQDVLHDPSRDLTFWSLMYLPDWYNNVNGSSIVLGVANGQTNLRYGLWNFYVFDPSDILNCFPQSQDWLDYPHLTRSNNFLYVGAKMFGRYGGFRCAFMLRISLDQLAAGGPLSWDAYSYTTSIETNLQAVYGATDTMYFARHIDTTTMRIYIWPESLSSPAITSISHASYLSSPEGSYLCTTPNGANPCGNEDDKIVTGYLSKGIAGFLWNVPQGTDGLGSFNYPHVRVLRVNVDNMSVVEDTALYSQTIAYLHPSLHPNSRGDLGGAIISAGGGSDPNCSVMIHDGNNSSSFADTDIYTVQTGTGSVLPADTYYYTRWGDYLRARVYPLWNGKAWLGTCYAYQYYPPTITPVVVRFNRPSDLNRWHERDFDPDGQADLVVWRPSSGTFFLLNSTNAYSNTLMSQSHQNLGTSGDWPLLGDFDGDREADLAVWRPSDATFQIWTSSSGYVFWNGDVEPLGVNGDWPLLGDLDGDGFSDLVVWRPSNATFYWFIYPVTFYSTMQSKRWGLAGDWPLLADVDGDGKADLCVWRASTGTFNCLLSSTAYSEKAFSKVWGTNGDWPLMADIDGDGKADLCVWRASARTSYFRCLLSSMSYSSTSAFVQGWGKVGDWPYLTDMDGDGKADPVVYRPGNNTFYWLTSSSGYSHGASRSAALGANGDQVPLVNYPIPVITNLNPTWATAGGLAFMLAVNGTNFVNGAKVRWNGSDRTTTFNSATTLTAQITAADIANAGTANVTVFNPAPGGGESFGVTFIIGKTPIYLPLMMR